MAAKQSFLLSRAHRFELQYIQDSYDADRQLNVVSRFGQTHPIATEDSFLHTESKTRAAPGDDDPDPEDEGCY